MKALLDQLPTFKEQELYLPYRASGDTVIYMFPKDEPKQDHNGFEICDVLIYNRDREEYFRLKTVGDGFTEILNHGVALRTGISDGGYMVRLRENAWIIEADGGGNSLFLMNEDTEMEKEFTVEDLKKALLRN
ncbi:hypothetical protein JOD82_001967 [Paenibacillus sp. 1182]|uniref:hypothetical protein n=1 Tax=Paenibacillus sp. 1182 TaxID=2806565 RepID=UPI001AE9AE87|nr:hypothetical protein [Paenibacillus sp. 1182]MBP1308947.1 hypothetical protein [Paenibacillus sp. 1182]